jgi:hypothetical protein
MATCCTLQSSDNNDYYSKINLNIEAIKPFIDRHKLKVEGEHLFWVSDFESLKTFAETIGLIGKWFSPGGRSKKFISTNINLIITWYYGKKGSLLFCGECAEMYKEMVVNTLSLYLDQVTTNATSKSLTVVDLEADLINVSDKSNIYANNTIPSKPIPTIASVLIMG